MTKKEECFANKRGNFNFEERKVCNGKVHLGSDRYLIIRNLSGTIEASISPTTNPSNSRYNLFEIVDFISNGGTYTVQIAQFINRNTSLRIEIILN